MQPPYIYKICLLGQTGSGKSSIAHRIVTHTFDASYRPTRQPAQLFWRYTEPTTGNDIMIELEDTPGISPETLESGDLTPNAQAEADALLKPLVWFEKLRHEKDARKSGPDEATPLCADGGGGAGSSRPRQSKGAGGSSGGGAAKGGPSRSLAGALASMSPFGGPAARSRSNPIGEDRKRMGFVIVADVSSAHSFTVAFAIADRIFDRVQFDVSDPITCPVAVIILGNKNDLRGAKRQVEDEATIRAEVQRRYENVRAEPRHAVLYCECSAQMNSGLEGAFLEGLERIRALPSRSRIRSARLRATGVCAQFKKDLYSCLPVCFDVEEACKHAHRAVLRPLANRLGLYALLCECRPLVALVSALVALVTRLLRFRWLCDWCPPFILRFRQEATPEAEEPDLEAAAARAAGVRGMAEAAE